MHTHGHPPRWRQGASSDRRPRVVAGHAARAPVVHRARDGCWRRRARQRGDVRPAGPFPASCYARLWAWGVQCARARDAQGERSAQRQRTQYRGGPGTTAARGTSPARRAAACVPQPVTQPPASTAPRPGQGSGPQTPWTLGARGLSRVCPAAPGGLPGPFVLACNISRRCAVLSGQFQASSRFGSDRSAAGVDVLSRLARAAAHPDVHPYLLQLVRARPQG